MSTAFIRRIQRIKVRPTDMETAVSMAAENRPHSFEAGLYLLCGAQPGRSAAYRQAVHTRLRALSKALDDPVSRGFFMPLTDGGMVSRAIVDAAATCRLNDALEFDAPALAQEAMQYAEPDGTS